ncbi:MAG: GFA family protein [Pseudomonadota bacterium]
MPRGTCECGAVAFEVTLSRTSVTVCHCTQCRRTSGHLWGSVKADYADLHFDRQDGLQWYASSDMAQRGFCRVCGSSLFYRMNGEAGIGISAGLFDTPTGFTTGKHIHTAHKGDYYDIADGAPQRED